MALKYLESTTKTKQNTKRAFYEHIKAYYPLDYSNNQLPEFLTEFFKILKLKLKNLDDARINQISGTKKYEALIEKYSILPKKVNNPLAVATEIVNELFDGVPRWRSPNLQHNVGAPVHTVASAMYSMALDENIYSIDDGLAGNALVAEKAVLNILSDLAGLNKQAAGFFVFGGTATNLYGAKVGLQKAYPAAATHGINHSVKLFVTEDSHFTHRLSADWLGIGTNNVITIKANFDRTSNLSDIEEKLRKSISSGDIIAAIMLNGGTTYNQTVDNITEVVKIRDNLVEEFHLNYKPHIHVDTVIGWSWLFFNDYDFLKNPQDFDFVALSKIKQQLFKVSGIKHADSWGVDFHKGIGGCPVDCSVIVFNNQKDVFAISKSNNGQLATHQLATEFTKYAPSEFTLETSRSAGTSLAALSVLRSLGKVGFQNNLYKLIQATNVFRNIIEKQNEMLIANNYSLGYSTMVRIYPPDYFYLYGKEDFSQKKELKEASIKYINEYIKTFYQWDFKTRIEFNKGPSASCSSSFFEYNGIKISALKFYPTSPHFDAKYAEITANTLISQKEIFDRTVWLKKERKQNAATS